MKKYMLAAAAGFAALGMSAAGAAMLDFAQYADDTGERNVGGAEILNIGGVNVQLVANVGFAYLDASGSEGPAGLGVCSMNNPQVGEECPVPSDDNVSIAEAVTINFVDGAFDIASLSFRNSIHQDLNGSSSTLLIGLNGGALVRYSFADAVAAAIGGAFLGANSITFAFDTDGDGEQFYVSAISDVPLPGALPLLLSGLAGLGFASRRRAS